MATAAGPGAALDGRFPAIWLRGNCPCPSCRDPASGQRLSSVVDLPENLAVAALEEATDAVTVTFAPDGHRSTFARAWLEEMARPSPGDGRTERAKRLWRAGDLEVLPGAHWARYVVDDAERLEVLRDVERLGFAVLRGTPCEPGTVLRVASTFGYVRETNYGELFDVRVEARPSNLAFTGLAIGPHTDNPYRDPVPTMQLLHCLRNAAAGGDSGLVDGFQAAALLRAEDPAAFEVLARTPVPFAWSDASASLRAEKPIIETDPLGQVRGVRFNGRSMQALRGSAAELAAFYAAYRSFATLLARPELCRTFRLEPGDCLVFDNVRLLHARTAFAEGAGGSRHLQGCYADLDALASTIAVLERAA